MSRGRGAAAASDRDAARDADDLGDVRAIVQRWLDGNEHSYPSHRALRDLATILHLERHTRGRSA